MLGFHQEHQQEHVAPLTSAAAVQQRYKPAKARLCYLSGHGFLLLQQVLGAACSLTDVYPAQNLLVAVLACLQQQQAAARGMQSRSKQKQAEQSGVRWADDQVEAEAVAATLPLGAARPYPT